MRASPYVLIAGFSALAVAYVGSRMIAPFYGLGPFLSAILLVVAFLAVALGVQLGGRRSPTPRSVGLSLIVAGLWTLLALILRRPVLEALEPLGLRVGVTIAAVLVIGPPLAVLGSIVPTAILTTLEEAAPPGRAATKVLSTFLVGLAAAAALVPFVVLPRLGISGTALVVGAVLVVAGALAWRARLGAGGAAIAVGVGIAGAATVLGPTLVRPRLPARVIAIEHAIGREIRVVEQGGARYLLEDGTIHGIVEPATWAGLRRPEAALMLVDLLGTEPGRALILGLRGGSLAKRLARAGWIVDVVDPDSAQARLARAWLGLTPDDARLVLDEPRAFLRRSRDSYDVIVIDAFADNFVRPELVTRECFAVVKGRLFQGGVVALVIEAEGWEDPLIRSIAATLGTAFEEVLALPTGEPPTALGSTILLASDRTLEIPDASLPQPFEHLADPLEHWNAVQMSHAWVNGFEPDPRGVPVLTDDLNPAEIWGERINVAARRELHRFFGAASDSAGISNPSW